MLCPPMSANVSYTRLKCTILDRIGFLELHWVGFVFEILSLVGLSLIEI